MVRALFLLCLFSLVSCAPQSRDVKPPDQHRTNAKGDVEANSTGIKNWHTKDLEIDGIPGTSADRAYQLSFVKQTVEPVVVAVIDGGTDITHEDLHANIWANLAEVNGQPGVDDDGNGYVDDFNGWNFLGGYDSEGKPTHITGERLEVTRELHRMRVLKAMKESQGLPFNDQAYMDELDKKVQEGRKEALDEIARNQAVKLQAQDLVKLIPSLNAEEFSKITLKLVEDLIKKSLSISEAQALQKLHVLMKDNRLSILGRIDSRIAYYQENLDSYYNETFNPREKIVGDDVSDFTHFGYGNHQVAGPLNEEGVFDDAFHGTHVSGIIGAVRDNKIGVDGIARDVRLMPLRAVPNGDEYDKDIANAVRYAADNGAKIINMSFGKGFSPYKEKVDEAFKYAAQKGVLIVHAAGNDSNNNDLKRFFPHRHTAMAPSTEIGGWLEIAASSKNFNLDLVAAFTNFGQTAVDLFAPGVDVESAIPGNAYGPASGTSMASPSASGVAAAVWSQFPTLTAEEVKTIVMQSAPRYSFLKVRLPGDKKEVSFGTLSRTGGIANAYYGMLLACEYTGQNDCK